ncbi:hypothetical protein D3C77_526410 [compost metagenome]
MKRHIVLLTTLCFALVTTACITGSVEGNSTKLTSSTDVSLSETSNTHKIATVAELGQYLDKYYSLLEYDHKTMNIKYMTNNENLNQNFHFSAILQT